MLEIHLPRIKKQKTILNELTKFKNLLCNIYRTTKYIRKHNSIGTLGT